MRCRPDPNRLPAEAVTRALVDAVVDYSTPMNIGPISRDYMAARDEQGRDTC